MRFVALDGNPVATSSTQALAAAAVDLAGGGHIVSLAELDADALLGRTASPDVDAVLAVLAASDVVLFATSVHRHGSSGLLKVMIDLLEPRALEGRAVVLAATAPGPGDELVIDHELRPLVARLGGWSVPLSLYATPDDFEPDGELGPRGRIVLSTAIQGARSALAGFRWIGHPSGEPSHWARSEPPQLRLITGEAGEAPAHAEAGAR